AVRLHAAEDVADVSRIAGQILRRFEPQASTHRQCAWRRAGAMGRRPDRAVRRADGDPERVPDWTTHRLIVADEAGKNREPRRVRRGPALRTPDVGREIEHRAGVGFPALRAAVPPRGEELVQAPAIAIDDEQVAIAARPAARRAAFDEAGLCRRGRRDRISGLTGEATVALVAIRDEGHRDARLAAADADVWNAVRRRSEVRMRRARPADEVDVRARLRIDGR